MWSKLLHDFFFWNKFTFIFLSTIPYYYITILPNRVIDAYIYIYIYRVFLGYIKENIKNVYGDKVFDDETRAIIIPENGINIIFPDVNVVLGKEPKLDFNSLSKSRYILN